MTDPMSILLSDDRDKKRMLALSSGLRRNKEIAQLAMLSGSKDVVNFGQNMYSNVQDKFKTRMGEKDREDKQEFTQDRYDVLNEQFGITANRADRTLAESIRHNKELESTAVLKATMARFKTPSASSAKATNATVSAALNVDTMIKGFKDVYANTTKIPFEGSYSNMMGDTPFGSDDQQEQVNWWKKYRQIYELGTRNELFGSALTAQEIKAWEAANIGPNSPPEQIRAGLQIMRQVAMQKAMQQYSSDQELYLPNWVDSVYAPLLSQEMQGGGGSGTPSEPTPYPQGAEPSLPQGNGPINYGDLP